MKDCTTFLKLQETTLNKQAEAKRQGYEENTSNAPASQQGNNGVPQGQDQPNQGRDDDRDMFHPKGTSQQCYSGIACAKVEQRGKKHNSPS
jgi:hypothetical protein